MIRASLYTIEELSKGRRPFPLETRRLYKKPSQQGYFQQKTEHGWEEIPIGTAEKENEEHPIASPSGDTIKRKGRSHIRTPQEVKKLHVILSHKGVKTSQRQPTSYKQHGKRAKT